MTQQLLCPVCQQELHSQEKQLSCDNNHSFDRARQGYFNLLLAHKKRSKNPGDSNEMVIARQRFLASGFYYPIADAVNQYLGQQVAKQPELALADVGCGEGYYTALMAEYLNNFAKQYDFYGVDISKEAIIQACKRSKDIHWLVASGNDMPVAKHSLDVVTCLFTRLMPEEFQRVLQQDGLLITVTTGKDHLIELRETLYDNIKPSVFSPESVLDERFELVASQDVKYQKTLQDSQQIQDLLLMTPHHWRATADKKAVLFAKEDMQISVHAQVHCFRPKAIIAETEQQAEPLTENLTD